MVRVSVRVSLAAVVLGLMACGGGAKVQPTLDISIRPRSIDNKTGKAVITVNATDALGKIGTGPVAISSTAGSLAAGDTLTLANGAATIEFTCPIATDPACLGSVKIDASWTSEGVKTTGTSSVTVTGPTGADAGPIVTGSIDGGTFGEYSISLRFEKPVLLQGTGDKMTVTARVTKTATPAVGVAGASVVFTAPGGASFAQNPTAMTTVTTDANGDARATLFIGAATTTIVLTASAFDASAFAGVAVVNIAKIEFVSDARTKPKLTIRSTGRDSSTSVFFKVTDASNMPVANVSVNFDIGAGSAAGCSVTNTAKTDATGIVQTVLASGEARGSVTVRAVVAATAGSTNELLATGSFEVIIGRPSDGKFNVQCARKTLGALQTQTPPRNDLETTCTVSMSDRYGAVVPFAVDVLWAAEAGSLASSTTSDLAGRSTNTYRTGNKLPSLVEPFPGEPFDGTRNPRDTFATILAATNGEEEFWDSSPDGGIGNGTWDQGEWFADQPEPYVDANDNGQYDTEEEFLDTERIDCATGQKQPRNGVWDGPNGCWDSNTLIWRSAHIIYSGGLATGVGQSGPFLGFFVSLSDGGVGLSERPVSTVNNDMTVAQPFVWFDAYYNRLSNDGIVVQVNAIGTGRALPTITSLNASFEGFGHQLVYYDARGTVSAGRITETGTCTENDRRAPPATGERCFRRFRIAAWRTSPLSGNLVFTGPPATVPPVGTTTQYQLEGGNTLSNRSLSATFGVYYPN